jgi:Protein of unknown function (DUF3761)
MRFRHTLCLLVLFGLTCQQITSQTVSQSATIASKPAQHKVLPNDPNCKNNGTYMNRDGQPVPRPETCSSAPSKATAQCRDGTYSFSMHRSGTCSHHEGVGKWL